MQSNHTKAVALSGVLAAVAVVIMCLGGFIPVATYVCPMLCTITQFLVLRFCGKRMGWTWFIVVSILSLLMSPDKEAAMVFLAIGYYPLVKFKMESHRFAFVYKLLLFNISILLVYSVMVYLMGMAEVVTESMEFGLIGLALMLIMGNITFVLLDRLLTLTARKFR